MAAARALGRRRGRYVGKIFLDAFSASYRPPVKIAEYLGYLSTYFTETHFEGLEPWRMSWYTRHYAVLYGITHELDF